MAFLIPPSVASFVARALAAAELGIVLEMDAEDIDTWRVTLDLPGPADLTFATDDGRVHVVAGPVEVDFDDGTVVARLDIPGPDLEVTFTDGKLTGPRFVPDRSTTGAGPLQLQKRTLVRNVRNGEYDAQLVELLQDEKAGDDRRAVVSALEDRLKVAPPVQPTAQGPQSVTVTPKSVTKPVDPLSYPKRTLVRAIRAGAYDDQLGELARREADGEGRRAVLRNLERRADEIG